MHPGGTVLAGRYRVVRQIGSGGMGTVYLAHDETLGRDVAVKSVHAEPDSDHGRRMMREARLGAGLRHPHLVTVYDVLAEGAALLLVMEYVEGETLADALRARPARDRAGARGAARGRRGARPRARAGRSSTATSSRRTSCSARRQRQARRPRDRDRRPRHADHAHRRRARHRRLHGAGAVRAGPRRPAPPTSTRSRPSRSRCSPGSRPYPGATAFEVVRAAARGRDAAGRPRAAARPAGRAWGTSLQPRHGDRSRGARPPTAGELVDELRRRSRAAARRPRPTAPGGPAVPAEPPRREPLPAPPRFAPVRTARGAACSSRSRWSPLAGARRRDRPRLRRRRGPAGAAAPATGTAATATTTQPSRPRAAVRPAPRPRTAVRAFYSRAADGDLGGAWRLAGPRMRAAFGNSREAFEADLGSLRAITFQPPRADGGQRRRRATVEIETTAQHTDRTERCTGTRPDGQERPRALGRRAARRRAATAPDSPVSPRG